MSLNVLPIRRPTHDRLAWREAALATLIAAIGWFALSIEFERSITASLAKGRGLAEALFLFFRFFTNTTNVGIALLMSVTVFRLLARRPIPSAPIFNGGLVYMIVTCVTYEVMLRGRWAPRGLQFVTDTAVHDIIPALTLVFWLAFAPRDGVRWRDAVWLIAYPAAFLAMTLIAGALGEGYPYDFLNVDKLGLGPVCEVALVFLVIFYALGLITTALSMRWNRQQR